MSPYQSSINDPDIVDSQEFQPTTYNPNATAPNYYNPDVQTTTLPHYFGENYPYFYY